MENCKEPKCNFSKRFGKCIKPNPYIETVAKCGRNKIKRKDCIYDKIKATEKSCNYYYERTGKKIKQLSSEKKEKSLSSSRKRKLEIIKKKIMARKIIKKFILPFTNRVSSNINSRIEYANKLNDEIKGISNNKCMEHISNGKYKIGNNIILDKRIGSESAYGIIYYSKLKLYKFAAKVMHVTADNKKEIKISTDLSNIVLKGENPHFPIIYNSFTCFKPINDPNYPDLVKKNNYFVLLNELANGDLKTLIQSIHLNNDLIINTIQQIYITILSFHKKTGFMHLDTHWGNFLYHKIKPGGYFHYHIKDLNKNFYIENKGYLWIIWDYGLANKIDNTKQKSVMMDYYRINNSFCNENNRGWVDNKYKIDNSITKLKQKLDNLYYTENNENQLWIQLEKYLFTDKYVPHKNEIINSTPFYL